MIYILKTAIKGTTFEVPNTVTKLTAGLIEIYQEIESIIIPASVTNIDMTFFTRNYNINNIEIDSNNPNYVSENGKIYSKDKTMLYLYYIKEQSVDISSENIKTIKTNAFDLCKNLETIILPETLEIIENHAFAFCENLKSITVPASVKTIGIAAFDGHADGFVIYGESGSSAETYATENGIAFEMLLYRRK